jgi:hypothetical protein
MLFSLINLLSRIRVWSWVLFYEAVSTQTRLAGCQKVLHVIWEEATVAYYRYCLEGNEENWDEFRRESSCSGRDTNREALEYKSRRHRHANKFDVTS